MVHQYCSMYEYFVPFYGQIILDCMDIPHFVYPFVPDGCLSCFYLLAIINNATINIYEQVFVWTYVSFLLGIYLKMELLVHMVTSHLNILRNCLCHFTFPLVVYESSYFSKSLLTLVII